MRPAGYGNVGAVQSIQSARLTEAPEPEPTFDLSRSFARVLQEGGDALHEEIGVFGLVGAMRGLRDGGVVVTFFPTPSAL